MHTHRDMAGIFVSGKYVLDLKEDTILWVDADPAWVTGLICSTFAPWLCGSTSLVQGDNFEAYNWYWTLEKHHVSVWYNTQDHNPNSWIFSCLGLEFRCL